MKKALLTISIFLLTGFSPCFATIVTDSSNDMVTDSSGDPVSDQNGPPPSLPVITSQPVNATVTAPAAATFTVTATGYPAPTYQWKQQIPGSSSFTIITGATSAGYTTPATTMDNSGTLYECVVTNAVGSVTTDVVTLTIDSALVITSQPVSTTVNAGTTATFTVAANGYPAPSYQWYQKSPGASSFTAISGATTAGYTTGTTTVGMSGTQYECVVSNSAGSVTSNPVTLTVASTPVLMGWWKLDTVTSGTTPDASGNGHTGTLYNGPTLVTGISGNAMTFNGTNQYVSVPNFSTNIASSPTLTVSCWVKDIAGAKGGACGMRANLDAPGAMYIMIYPGNNALETRVRTSTGVATWDSGSVLTAGAWNLITLVYNGSTMVTYVNGTAVNTKSAVLSNFGVSNIPFWIGNGSYSSAYPYYANFPVDDVRVYNGALSASDVAQLYAATIEPVPTVSLSSNSSSYVTPANVALTASASQTGGTISKVEFYNDTALLGTATTSPYTYTWSNVPAGSYSLTAKAYNNAGGSAVSNAVTVTVTDPNVYIKNISYNANGQMTQIQYGNGVTTAYTYNPLNLRLMRIYTTNAQAQVLQDLNYTYDSIGQLLSVTDNVNSGDQSMNAIYTYDALNRLTSASGSYGVKTYAYDEIGNIKQKDGLAYNYGEANSRTDGSAAGPHAVTSLSDGTTFKYDLNGNMVSLQKGTGSLNQYVYDSQNRLTQVVVGGLTAASYVYDGDGGRTEKTVVRRDLALYNDNADPTFFGSVASPLPATAANPTVDTTLDVGNLYETESGVSRSTKFIYGSSDFVVQEKQRFIDATRSLKT